MKKISIIIANYNYAQYLADAIHSALAQTYVNTEVIVIDDGSSDNSLEIASSFDVTVLSQKNLGVSAARNNAVMQASGDYVLFLDADDLLHPDALDNLCKPLDRASDDIAYAYGQMEYFGYKDGFFGSSPFDEKKLARSNYICVTCLIRKDRFLDIGGFDRSMKNREDWELFVRFLHRGYKGVFLEKSIMRCRKHRPPEKRSAKHSRQKAHVTARLFWRFPRFFRSIFLKKPLRHLLALLDQNNRRGGEFGPVGHPHVIKTGSKTLMMRALAD